MAGKVRLTDEQICLNLIRVYGEKYTFRKIFRNDNADIKVLVKCNLCEGERVMDYNNLRRGRTSCKCMNQKALKKLSKDYAKLLYIEPSRGLIVGDELLNYISECIEYDYPMLNRHNDFLYDVEDELLSLYEKNKVIRCPK